MSGRRKIFSELRSIPAKHVSGISGKISAGGVGTICVRLAGMARVRLQDAIYVPGMAATHISSACLSTTKGYTLVLGAQGSILERQHRVVASASRQNNSLCKLVGKIIMCEPNLSCAFVAMRQGLLLTTWHLCFSHLHYAQNLARSGAVTGLVLNPSDAGNCSDVFL